MKTAMLLLVSSVSFLAQPAPVLPLPARELSKGFLATCSEGDRILSQLIGGDKSVREDLIQLVLQLEYDVIVAQENRRKSGDISKKARECTKELAQRTWIYFRRTNASTKSLKVRPKWTRWWYNEIRWRLGTRAWRSLLHQALDLNMLYFGVFNNVS